jgi:DNA recombination protein RmuC
LGAASNHYNKTVNALMGQRGLHGKVERFSSLSSKVSKSMPELEAKHIDFEHDRLALIAEPVEEKVEPKAVIAPRGDADKKPQKMD